MKWGLRGRLTAALIGVTLLGLALATAIYQALTAGGFTELLVEQARPGFIADATFYYTKTVTPAFAAA